MSYPQWPSPLRERSTRAARCTGPVAPARGFTLVEVLAATALALLMMATVVSMFAVIGDNVSESRAAVEMNERLRQTQLTLQKDLEGVTGGDVAPSRDPEAGDGSFEIIEGPVGPVIAPYEVGYMPDGTEMPAAVTADSLDSSAEFTPDYIINGIDYRPDTTVGDFDDVIMFTTRSSGEPFVGRADTRWAPSATIESNVAEVCWFLRGTTLYRRQLLVVPSLQRALEAQLSSLSDADLTTFLANFYFYNDLSVHMEGGPLDHRANEAKPLRPTLVLNTLGDLTKRENRYGHQPFAYPHDPRFWSVLSMPTLRDCCSGLTPGGYVWPFPYVPAGDFDEIQHDLGGGSFPLPRTIVAPKDLLTGKIGGTGGSDREVWHVLFNDPQNTGNVYVPYGRDLWSENNPALAALLANPKYVNNSYRISDDVILTNVISFDVEVWDPGAPIYERPNDSGVNVAVVPGDPLYAQAVLDDMGDRDGNNRPNGNLGPVSFGAFVDLNYMARLPRASGLEAFGVTFRDPHYAPPTLPQPAPRPQFQHAGERNSFLRGTRPTSDPIVNFEDLKASVYDTWSTHYEHDGLNQDATEGHVGANIIDQQTNGLDEPITEVPPSSGTYVRANGADDVTEREAPPPYDAPVEAVRIKIRVFEPDSEQIREVTVVQNY
ncbi:MAG: hypothetical protein R3C10_01680 [Pirellulales bacterium]